MVCNKTAVNSAGVVFGISCSKESPMQEPIQNWRKSVKRSLAALVRLGITVAAITLTLALNAQAQTETMLYSFVGGTDGSYPYGGLVADSAGNLYGTTQFGGDLGFCKGVGCGTIFELSPNGQGGWTKNVLHNFISTDGAYPMGGLILDGSGSLYGTTENGGASDDGVAFRLSPNSSGGWDETVLHSFNGSDGAQPRGTLAFDARGSLYGTTTFGGLNRCAPFSGCGSVFELTPTSSGPWKETIIHRFTGGRAGGNPESGVALDTAVDIFGTLEFGGMVQKGCPSSGCGLVYELTPNSFGRFTFNQLHAFQGGTDGATPIAGVTVDIASGHVFGTTEFGGAKGLGVVYELSHDGNGWSEKELHSFYENASNDGGEPWAGVVFDKVGNLYGVTYNGGLFDGGAAYKLTPSVSGWNETVLYNFSLFATPFSNVTIGSSGRVFGTTADGGSSSNCVNGCGQVFEIRQ